MSLVSPPSSNTFKTRFFSMVWRRNDDSHQLQLDPDQHCVVDPWHFGPDPNPQIRTIDLCIRIYIRIRLRIRIRIQISDPGVGKAPDPDLQYCFLNVLLLFFACWWKDPDPDVDPDPDHNKWWRIRIQEAQVKTTKILWCWSRSGCRSKSWS
jgi:hypothetical protein